METSNLIHIDTCAKNANYKDEMKEEEDRLILKMMQTGSSWSKAVTQKTGTCEDDICDLCKEAKETSDHIWYCSRLEEKRKELDAEIAEADPEEYTPAMRHGVACAMDAGPRSTYWGAECKEAWGKRKKWRYGCRKEGELKEEVREVMQQLGKLEGGEDFTAREMITGLMMKGDKEEMVRPKMKSRVEEEASGEPNVFSDGSLRNIKRGILASWRSRSMAPYKKGR